jgi:uncharacterized protein (TIGR00297 family)
VLYCAVLPYVIIVLLASAAVLLRKLTPPAGLAGALVATCMYLGLGIAGLALLGTFFVLGTGATAWKGDRKKRQGLREANGGQRKVVQVLANGGTAATCALAAAFMRYHVRVEYGPDQQTPLLFPVMAAAALSAATADTLASELGNVYGSRFVDIRTFRPGQKGQDGIISLEGTMAGLCGSIVIAALFYTLVRPGTFELFVIIAAGTFGNLFDSALGATLQRRGRLSNDGVNLLNTAAAALFAAALLLL